MAEPFACGHIFVSSVFDSLTTVAFHSPGTITLLEHLLCISGDSSAAAKSTIMQIPVTQQLLRQLAKNQYNEVFKYFCFHNILCIAVYRRIRNGSNSRYVITAPPKTLCITTSDIIFAIKLGTTT